MQKEHDIAKCNCEMYIYTVLSELHIITLFRDEYAKVGRRRWEYFISGQGIDEKTIDNIYKSTKLDKGILRGEKPLTLYKPAKPGEYFETDEYIEQQKAEYKCKTSKELNLEYNIRSLVKCLKSNKLQDGIIETINPDLIKLIKSCIKIYNSRYDTDMDAKIDQLLNQLEVTTVKVYKNANTQKVERLKKAFLDHLEIIKAIETLTMYE